MRMPHDLGRTTMTSKCWKQSIQELIDHVAKPNWKKADKHGETAERLYNACFEVWLAAPCEQIIRYDAQNTGARDGSWIMM